MSTFAANIFVHNSISNLDWLVLISILLLHILAVFTGRFKQLPQNENLVMNRKLGLFLLAPSLVVAWYGKIFTVTALAFDNGLYNFYTQGLFWYVAYLFFAFFLVKKIRTYNAVTLPDLISKMYGVKSTMFAATLVFIKSLPIVYLISLSIVLKTFIGISYSQVACLVLLALVLFTTISGVRGLVYSNLIHFFCVILALGLVVIFSITELGGLNFLYSNLPPTYFQPRGIHSIANMLAWFAIAFSTTMISPVFYQYSLSAKNDRAATNGVLIAICFWVLIDFCTTTGAMYAKAVLPDVNAFNAYIIYAIQLLPDGVKGLFIAGIVGTVIPSITTGLSIASTSLHHGILENNNYRSTNRLRLLTTISLMICMVVFATYFYDEYAGSWSILKSFFIGLLLMPVLIGLFYPKLAVKKTLLMSLMLSSSVMVLWVFGDLQAATKISPVLAGCIASSVVFAKLYYSTRCSKINNSVIVNSLVN